MSVSNVSAKQGSESTFKPYTAFQCVKKHANSLQSMPAYAFSKQKDIDPGLSNVVNDMKSFLKAFTTACESSIQYKKGKRVVPVKGEPGSSEWFLTQHSEFRSRAEVFMDRLSDPNRRYLKDKSTPSWTGCRCKTISQDLAIGDSTVSQAGTTANTTLDAEEEEKEDEESIPENWDEQSS
jgi:uncharacterized FlaG/YvyC family protein